MSTENSYIVILKNDHLAGMPIDIQHKYIKIESSYDSVIRGFCGTIPDDKIAELSTHPHVQAIVKDIKIAHIPPVLAAAHPGTPSSKNSDLNNFLPAALSAKSSVPWGIMELNAPAVSKMGILKNIEIDSDVYIIDSGVDEKHQDLNVVESVSMVRRLFGPGPIHGHGTHVAGIIGAKDNIIGTVGVAPGVKIRSIRVLDEYGEGMLSWMLGGLDFIAKRLNSRLNKNKPLLVNLSLGFETKSTEYTYLDRIIESLASKGVIFVAAAGNSGRDAGTMSPAHCSGVIAVGAYNFDHQYCKFSNYGNVVSACAPGEDILSTWPNNSYALLTGTSMAAPHITGLIALYLSANKCPTNVNVKTILAWFKSIKSKDKEISDIPSSDTKVFPLSLPPGFYFKGKFNIVCTLEHLKAGSKTIKYLSSHTE